MATLKGYGIARKHDGYIVLSRPNTTGEYWRKDLETIQQNNAIREITTEYEIIPVAFSRRGVYAVQTHDKVTVLKPSRI